MLLPHKRLIGAAIMSLQTGAELARVKNILIDPRNLTIAAYELDGPMLDQHPSFLRPMDARELSSLGLIVDSSEEFIGIDDVIAVRQVYDFGFSIEDIPVIDDAKHKLGKVDGYSVDGDSFSIQQLIVKRPLLRSFNESELTIHRSQIVEVTNDRILVKSASDKSRSTSHIREYANPFRNSSPQPEAFESWR